MATKGERVRKNLRLQTSRKQKVVEESSKGSEMANYEEDSESDSEFEPGQKRKRVVHEKTGPN